MQSSSDIRPFVSSQSEKGEGMSSKEKDMVLVTSVAGKLRQRKKH